MDARDALGAVDRAGDEYRLVDGGDDGSHEGEDISGGPIGQQVLSPHKMRRRIDMRSPLPDVTIFMAEEAAASGADPLIVVIEDRALLGLERRAMRNAWIERVSKIDKATFPQEVESFQRTGSLHIILSLTVDPVQHVYCVH